MENTMTNTTHSTADQDQATTYRMELEKAPWPPAAIIGIAVIGLLIPVVSMIGAVAAWVTGRTEQAKTLGLCALGAWIVNIFAMMAMA
jgi:hypothetical protein